MDTPLAYWKQDYRWMRESEADDTRSCWRSLAKMEANGAWQERRAIRAEQRAAQLEAERDIYKDGFDALTTANEQIVKERDYLQRRVESLQIALNVLDKDNDAIRRALAQHVTTRAEAQRQYNELKDTHREYLQAFDRLTIINNDHNVEIEKLKAENEAQAKRIKELEDSDAHFSRAMSEALNEGDGVYRP